jgi:hypothetical protein
MDRGLWSPEATLSILEVAGRLFLSASYLVLILPVQL